MAVWHAPSSNLAHIRPTTHQRCNHGALAPLASKRVFQSRLNSRLLLLPLGWREDPADEEWEALRVGAGTN
jgi:hypothetical protein